MIAASKYCKEQYEYVRDSRGVLLEYCKTISSNDLLGENHSFGRGGSIRNLLVHIANTYEFWIASCALKKTVVFTKYESIENIYDIIRLFDLVDNLMYELIALLEKEENKQIHYEINGIQNSADAFKLFSHLITHEFHHKGQILSLSRHFGYVPVDTDIMR
jgi:uncharacterized damage-inducible protein DinB